MPTASELKGQLNSKRDAAAAFLEAFKGADGQYDMPTDKVGQYRKRNDEVDDLAQQWEAAVEAEKVAAVEAVKSESQGRMVKDAGDFEAKDAGIQTKAALNAAFSKGFADQRFRDYQEGDAPKRFEIPADLKTIVTLTSSYDTQPTQVGRFESALFYGDVEPYFPSGPVTSDSIVGYIQGTDTDNSAAVAENVAATDSAFAWTATTDEIEDVQTWIPISRNLLSDEAQMQSTITGMLAKRLQKKISGYILTGTGTTPVPWGVFIRTGFQTQAKGTDPAFDAIYKALVKVRVTGDADPNLCVLHPTDLQSLRLTRTTDGVYVMGSPMDAGPARIWGLPIVESTGMTQGTGGVVDTSFTTIFNNGGLTVEVSTEHSTYFTERKMALSLVRRVGFWHGRPSAAATITGL